MATTTLSADNLERTVTDNDAGCDTVDRRQPRRGPVRAAVVDRVADSLRVEHQAGDRFEIVIRNHTVTTDQPETAGGDDAGPTPTELFVASLASCVAFYARRYLARHHIDPEGLSVQASYELATKPARVADIEINVQAPPGLSQARRDGLLAVAGHCTVHNSITTPPTITLGLAGRDPAGSPVDARAAS